MGLDLAVIRLVAVKELRESLRDRFRWSLRSVVTS